MKQKNYIVINYNTKINLWEIYLIKTIKIIKKQFKENDIYNVLNLILNTKTKSTTKKDFIIYVRDLKKFVKLLNNNEEIITNLSLTSFEYHNTLYYVKITNIIYPNKTIILKEYYNFIPINKETTPIETCLNDLQQLAKTINEIFHINIHNKRILSLTSLATKIFAKISPEKKKLIIKLNYKEDCFIRKSFIGGRSEIFNPLHKGDLFYYDVNSLYPFIMQNEKMPIGIPQLRKTQDINLETFFGFVKVVITTPSDDKIKILPKRLNNNLINMGVIYPKGTFSGIYFSEELKLAIKHGYKVIKIIKGYEFKSSIIFDNFITKLFDIKTTLKDSKLQKLFKIMMNSIYGKYAGIYSNKQLIPFIKQAIEKTIYANVGISSAISSYARCFMFNIIKNYEKDLLYLDTDGIILKKALEENLIHPIQLGKFKLVANLLEYAAIATKFYMYTIKETKQVIYVYRGVTVKDHIMNSEYLYQVFYTYINKNITGTYFIDIEFYLLNLDNTDELMVFVFTNKRKFYKENNIIKTQPWEYFLNKKI